MEDGKQNGSEEALSLKLYIAGMSSRSAAALETVTKICEGELKDRCSLEVIDIYQKPERARDNQIVAVPTLVKEAPEPLRVLIGDLSNPDRIRALLGLKPEVSQGRAERI
ncbi:MAG: circadian clock KaiB family protein [Bdellovibrionales bacterium]